MFKYVYIQVHLSRQVGTYLYKYNFIQALQCILNMNMNISYGIGYFLVTLPESCVALTITFG